MENEKFFELTPPEAKKKKTAKSEPEGTKGVTIRGRHNGDRFQMSFLVDRAKDVVAISDDLYMKIFKATQRKYGKLLKGVNGDMFRDVNALKRFAGEFPLKQKRPIADLVVSGIDIDVEKRTAKVACYLNFYFRCSCIDSANGAFLRNVFEFSNQTSLPEADFIGCRWMFSVNLNGLNCPMQIRARMDNGHGSPIRHLYVTGHELNELHFLSMKKRGSEEIILEPVRETGSLPPMFMRLSTAEYERFLLKYNVCN